MESYEPQIVLDKRMRWSHRCNDTDFLRLSGLSNLDIAMKYIYLIPLAIGLVVAATKLTSAPPIQILLIDHARHYVQTCQQIRWTTSGDITQRPNIAEFGEPCIADTIFYGGFQ